VARFEALLAENFSVDPEEVPIVVEPQLHPVEDWTRDGLLVRRYAPASASNASLPSDGVNVIVPDDPPRTITSIKDGEVVTVPVTPVEGNIARLTPADGVNVLAPSEPSFVYPPAIPTSAPVYPATVGTFVPESEAK
jgi:hypothetical protein